MGRVYGLPLRLADDARGLDLSPVWFAQLGAAASTEWLAGLDLARVRDHCVGLADTVLHRARAATAPAPRSSRSTSPPARSNGSARPAWSASIRAGRTRLSCHLYNTEDDVDRVLGALATR